MVDTRSAGCDHRCAQIGRRIILTPTMPAPGNADGLLRSYAAQPTKTFDWEPVFSIAPRTKAPVVRERIDDGGQVHRTL